MTTAIEAFHLSVPDSELEDLRNRLDRTRWPDREPVDDWSQGVPSHVIRSLCDYWRTQYDWRRCEAMLNRLGQFQTAIDGVTIHFLHVRSPERGALPLLLTHGWPGSVIEFHKVIGPLTDPARYGGNAGDAFHLVIPSLPGYGFSGKPSCAGWGIERIADAWIELMRRLEYDRYVAQGGDWGAVVTKAIAARLTAGCAAIHLNLPLVVPSSEEAINASAAESEYLAGIQYYTDIESGYAKQQSTRPQTLGYGLADSPAGQAAWIYEKLHCWADNRRMPEGILSMDEILDNIMLYWLPNAGTSSARLYWESMATAFTSRPIDLPVGVSIFPRELFRASRRWCERYYGNIIHWNELEEGGHFAAFEQPATFVAELRNCFRRVR